MWEVIEPGSRFADQLPARNIIMATGIEANVLGLLFGAQEVERRLSGWQELRLWNTLLATALDGALELAKRTRR